MFLSASAAPRGYRAFGSSAGICADSELVVFVRYSQRGCLGQEVGKLVGQQSRFLSARAPILGVVEKRRQCGICLLRQVSAKPKQPYYRASDDDRTKGKYDC